MMTLRTLLWAGIIAMVPSTSFAEIRISPSSYFLEWGNTESGNRRPIKWGERRAATSAVIRYTFLTEPFAFGSGIWPAGGCTNLRPLADALQREGSVPLSTFEEEVRKAIDSWSAAANITFLYTKSKEEAQLFIGATGNGWAAASNLELTLSATDKLHSVEKGAVCFDVRRSWQVSNIRFSALHELGHIVGLRHPDPSTQSVMARASGEAVLSKSDVAHLQELYGARMLATPAR